MNESIRVLIKCMIKVTHFLTEMMIFFKKYDDDYYDTTHDDGGKIILISRSTMFLH